MANSPWLIHHDKFTMANVPWQIQHGKLYMENYSFLELLQIQMQMQQTAIMFN